MAPVKARSQPDHMTLPADIDSLALIAKLVAAASLFVAGVVLLVQATLARRPARVVAGRVIPRRHHRAAPTTVQPPAPRLGPGTELRRLASVMDAARTHLDTITSSQRAAARHLDSAEIALNRLLSEIIDVMPPAIAPTIVPRRIASQVLSAKSALAA